VTEVFWALQNHSLCFITLRNKLVLTGERPYTGCKYDFLLPENDCAQGQMAVIRKM
jgi:hypothetical protein